MVGKVSLVAALMVSAGWAGAAAPSIKSMVAFGSADTDLALGIAAGPDPDVVLFSGSVGENVVLPGGTSIPGNGVSDAFLAGLDQRTGAPAWTILHGGSGEQRALRVHKSAFGDIFITGSPVGPSTLMANPPIQFETTLTDPDYTPPETPTSDAFVAKLDSGGNLLWYDVPEGPLSNFTNECAPDRSGGIYVAGITRKQMTFNPGRGTALRLPATGNPPDAFNAYLVRYDAGGVVEWARLAGGGQNSPGGREEDDGATSVTLMPDDGAVAVGSFRGQFLGNKGEPDEQFLAGNGATDGWAARWNSDGQLLWQRAFGGPGDEVAYAVTAIPGGDVIIAGSFQAGALFPADGGDNFEPFCRGGVDIFVACLDGASGDARWVQTLGSSGDDVAWGASAAPDADRIHIGGSYGGALLDQSGATVLPGAIGSDGFLTSYTATGARGQVFTFAGSGDQVIYAVTGLSFGRVGFSAAFTGPGTITAGTATRSVPHVAATDGAVAVIDTGEGPLQSLWMVR